MFLLNYLAMFFMHYLTIHPFSMKFGTLDLEEEDRLHFK